MFHFPDFFKFDGCRITCILNPIRRPLFFYLFILNFISNFGAYIYFNDLQATLCMVMLAAWIAYIEVALYLLFCNKYLRIIWVSFLVLLHNLLIISDYFLNTQFHMALGQDVIDILCETNIIEIKNFVNTYMSLKSILVWISLLFLVNFAAYKISLYLFRINILRKVLFGCVLFGSGVMAFCAYNYAIYHNGMAIPQYQTTTRVGYAFYILSQRMQKIVHLQNVCRNTKAVSTLKDKPTIVLVIGESHSVYHSSLYGYEKPTMPCMEKRVNDSTLYVFDNVISPACATHNAMLSIFSLDSLGVEFGNVPVFPACFRAADYKVLMYDNQYFVGHNVTFLSDEKLSLLLFDERNSERYNYDMEMINTIELVDSPALYVIHLWGQHYTYSDRYPPQKEFKNFSSNDYDRSRWTEEQREIIAHYDNATRYIDKILDEIISRFENKNCCVVYLSDHGEEIYDLSNYMGHGNAEHSSDLNYQIRVPFMIWTSHTYSQPEIVAKLPSLQHIPITTDDVSHLLLDLAGIQTPFFEPRRSAVNECYNKEKDRFVLNAIKYNR